LFEKIIQNGSFKLERIISKGHSTPKGKWYDQMIVLNLPVSFSNPSSEEEKKRSKKSGLNELMKEVRKSYILDCLDGL